jgi:hypothetical protein
MKMLSFAGIIIALSMPVSAHHATIANFTQEIISVEGVIEKVRFQNPHSSILIKKKSDDDSEIFWLIETGAKTTLVRKGVTMDRMAVGSKITATGRKGRRQYTMLLQEIVFEDGSIFTPEPEKN